CQLNESEKDVARRFAEKVVQYNMTAPAILFLEAYSPMSFIGSQAMLVFRPLLNVLMTMKSYDKVQTLMEKREGIEYLIKEIERTEREKGV
ncbi:MAG: hypothetical protein ACOCWO_02220, partial [Candidatus Muiribacteriaceae bacterium]